MICRVKVPVVVRRPHKVLHERFNPDNPYLYRWQLWRSPFGLLTVYLHRIVRPDDDPDPHDHPWLFWVSLILEGGYREEVYDRWPEGTPWWACKTRVPGDFYFATKHLHRIDRLWTGESWSLVLIGPKVREWGFVNKVSGCWTQWRSYIQGERC